MSIFLNTLKKLLLEHKKYLLIIISTAGVYFAIIFLNIISLKPSGFYAGHQNVWSDWALHITLTNTFANKPIGEWLLYHPYFSGGKLTYPSLTNMISGILMKLGLNITQAMIWPSILYVLILLIGIYFLFFQLLKSKNKAILGIFIFLTSAGPGFINFIKELNIHPTTNLLIFPPIDYTRIVKYQWLAGNIPVAMLIPQRSFLLGLTIGVWSLLLFITAIQQKSFLNDQKKYSKNKSVMKKLFLISGILAGILPVAHVHSFISIVVITGFICLAKLFEKNNLSKKASKLSKIKIIKKLLFFILPATAISIFLFIYFISGGIQKSDFMKISFGWTSDKNILSWIKMWWEIWGVMIPVSIYSFKKLNWSSNFYGFFALFIISNIIIFQPTPWDNSKLFAWVYLGFSLLAANLLVELWKNKINDKFIVIKRIIAVILIIFLSTSGILELIRLQRFDKNTFKMSELEDIRFAKIVMKNTKTDDVFLTSSDHNHPLQMWGSRSIVLGYKGWVTNFGFDINQRSIDVVNIFEKPEESLNIISKYNINYIVIGIPEKREFVINQKYFDENFQKSFQNSNTIIYKVK